MNKFLTNPLIALLIKKLPYKNTDEWMEKQSQIPQDFLDDKQIKHTFDI